MVSVYGKLYPKFRRCVVTIGEHVYLHSRRSHRGKMKYRTMNDAEDAAKRLNDKIALRFAYVVAYKCQYCPRFHVGRHK